MFILDTNILAETMRPRPDCNVISWLNAQERSKLYLTAVSQAELFYGIEIMPEGSRKALYAETLEIMFKNLFAGRILSFDQKASLFYAKLAAYRKHIGKPISQFDAQIAAIAQSHHATIVTRNVKDFKECGLKLLNPWQNL